ncbi:uncharacterized protein HGUI_00065 [Hanseniaspora guilliermondii]|uniref:Uncharacterized protein n=1 Tax=Hanseniaspora guilliermondii TaxID=56406 RepID=A0A1L0CHU1_9ASCO|nr:uncharacterized protein HGUI_00065 [Hanseniaspora guilliermondii]
MANIVVSKKLATENDIKSNTDHRPLNKDIVIKRSKSTGIVLKQKKSHIGNLKHFHAKSIPNSTSKVNESSKASKKIQSKDNKDVKQHTKAPPKKQNEKAKARNNESCKSKENKENEELKIEKLTRVTDKKDSNEDTTKTSDITHKSNHIIIKSNSESSNTITPTSVLETKGSCDSSDTITEKPQITKERDISIERVMQTSNDEKEFSIQNGLNTPPLSTLNTSSNSDVEMSNEETNKEKESSVPNIQPKVSVSSSNIPSNHIHNEKTNTSDHKETTNKTVTKEDKNNNLYQNKNLILDLNMDSLSGIKSESVPMTPSYTKSIDESKNKVIDEPQKTASFLKSPKEETFDGVKLSKKASQLKKKIIQRKSKNDILKLELNQLIENLQHLKKQYDMISTTFNDNFDDASLKKDINPDSLISTEMEGIDGKFVRELTPQGNSDLIDIPGYYIKRTGNAVFGDIDDTNAFLKEPKKRKIDTSNSMDSIEPITNTTKTVNDILSTSLSQEKLPIDVDSIPLVTFDEILQPEKKIMDFALNDNGISSFDDKRSMSNGFDFLLDINNDMALDDDINMDFFNF